MEYLILPFVEIEIRFGYLNDKKFDTSVDKEYFKKISDMLDSETKEWVSIEVINTTEYFNPSIIKNKIKLINNELILKENVLTKTIQIKNSPFDIRFQINQEFNINSQITDEYSSDYNESNCRKKQRKTYKNKNYKYDLTVVQETINNITKEKHEIEIEIFPTSETIKWDKQYINDFLECKIYDLINIVEKIEPVKLDLFN